MIRKRRLISKLDFTTWETITLNILPNISRSKGNQTMKFGQIIEKNKINFFFRNHAKNEPEKLVRDPFCVLKKLYVR